MGLLDHAPTKSTPPLPRLEAMAHGRDTTKCPRHTHACDGQVVFEVLRQWGVLDPEGQ